MYTYLTITGGSQSGATFLLDPDNPNRIGRGWDCVVKLQDDLCSRVHAVVSRVGSAWIVEDAGSRNGTLVNQERVKSISVAEGDRLKVGGTEMVLHESELPPTVAGDPREPPQRLVKKADIRNAEPGYEVLPLTLDAGQVGELVTLHRYGTRLVGCTRLSDFVSSTLELLSDAFAGATSWVVLDLPGGRRKWHGPHPAVERVEPDKEVAVTACREQQALWFAGHGNSGGSRKSGLDVLCVPLVGGGTVRGALLAQCPQRFRPSQFEFLISIANVASLAAVRLLDSQRLVGVTPASCETVEDLKLTPQTVAAASTLSIDFWEKALVIEALRRTGDQVHQAARLLGLSRATMYRKIDEYGLSKKSDLPHTVVRKPE